jgi:cation diffusion facilitator family transporter
MARARGGAPESGDVHRGAGASVEHDFEAAYRKGRQAAVLGIVGSGALAVLKITAGIAGNSTAVFSDGVESAMDVLTSTVVLGGMTLALRPPDADHPYGHGRAESIAGKTVSTILLVTGLLLAFNSAFGFTSTQHAPELYAIATLVVSILVKASLSAYKMGLGRRLNSASLQADAWNDRVDIVSALAALAGSGLAAWAPERFLFLDRVGGGLVALVVIYTGARIFRDTSLELMDTSPPADLLDRVRRLAAEVDGVIAIETCRGRKSGLGHFFDLHVEVDPGLSVLVAHRIAHAIKDRIRSQIPTVLDVLVHIEPAAGHQEGTARPRPPAADRP